MRDEDFTAAAPGRLVAIAGDARAFVPAPIPRGLSLSADTIRLIGGARAALGRLEAGVATLPRPELLVRPFQKNEAVLSSRIEGTRTTLEEALVDAASGLTGHADADARAVRNYDTALQLGLGELQAGRDLTLALLRGLQTELVKGDAHLVAHAGSFRDRQVGIGPAACARDIRLARFIPPPPEQMPGCLDDLAAYLTETPRDEPLVRIAVTHYQFESIHPFGDGNGRVGRLLIALQMIREGVVTKPWVYLSSDFERRKQEYVECLYRVSTSGAFEDWLRFFLECVLSASNTTLAKLAQMETLREDFIARLQGYHSQRPLRLLPTLFGGPVITIPDAAEVLACTKASARNTLLELERRKIVAKLDRPLRHGQLGRPRDMYICREIVNIFLD